MMEMVWCLLIVAAAVICAQILGKQKEERKRTEEDAIRFAEECYIEGIIPIQKVKRLAEFYLVEESEGKISWSESAKRIEETLNRYTKNEGKS